MAFRPKNLRNQVLVITGATSGIGLATARLAARKGARLVLAARSESALRQLSDELNALGLRSRSHGHAFASSTRQNIDENDLRSHDLPAGIDVPSGHAIGASGMSVAGDHDTDQGAANVSGGRAVAVVADVANEADVKRIAETAIEAFGGFDTWINNAAVAIYGYLDQVPMAEMRRLMDVDFWGVVHGSLAAIEHFKDRGGTLINMGSVLSDRAIPVQGIYTAAKHAVKGFTDSLRMEMEMRGFPIAITLIKPTSIDTPYPHHAKNYMKKEASLPPPVYAPDVVARTILHCAEHPHRDVYVGGGAKMMAASGQYAPRITDAVMEKTMLRMQQQDKPAPKRDDHNLFNPMQDFRERGDYPGHVSRSSMYTAASLHPLTTLAIAGGTALALGMALRCVSARRNGQRTHHDVEIEGSYLSRAEAIH
jgi:short-subunit dehydrogenase